MVDLVIQNGLPLSGLALVLLASSHLVRAFGEAISRVILARHGIALGKVSEPFDPASVSRATRKAAHSIGSEGPN